MLIIQNTKTLLKLQTNIFSIKPYPILLLTRNMHRAGSTTRKSLLSLYKGYCTSLVNTDTKKIYKKSTEQQLKTMFFDLYTVYCEYVNSVKKQKMKVKLYLHAPFPTLVENPHKITRHLLNTIPLFGLALSNLRLKNQPFKLYLTDVKNLKGLRIVDVALTIKYGNKDYKSNFSFHKDIENSYEFSFLMKLIRDQDAQNILSNHLYSEVLKRPEFSHLIKRYGENFFREVTSIFIQTLLNNIAYSFIPSNKQYPESSWYTFTYYKFFNQVKLSMDEKVLKSFLFYLKSNIPEVFYMHYQYYLQVDEIHKQTTKILRGFFCLFANNECVPYSLELFNLGKLLRALCDMEVQRHVFHGYWECMEEISRGNFMEEDYFARDANKNVRMVQFHTTIFCVILSYLYSFLMSLLDYVVSINALFIKPCNLEKEKSKIFKITETSNFIFSLEALLQARKFDKEASLKKLFADKKNELHLKNLTILLKIFNPTLVIEDISIKNLELIGKWPCISIGSFNQLLNQIRGLHDLVSSYGFPMPINLRELANHPIGDVIEFFSSDPNEFINKNYSLGLLEQISFEYIMKDLLDIDKYNLEELSPQFMFLHYSKVSNNYMRVIKLSPMTTVNLY
jgi:hypothetical protein